MFSGEGVQFDFVDKDANKDILKALIFRYGTGTYKGIFLVRDMLVNYLGFYMDDIEICWFDHDLGDSSPVASQPKRCTLGQDPPTFRNKFIEFLSSAKEGDVHFLYVDAHGTTYPSDVNPNEREIEGWIFAGTNDGTIEEAVEDSQRLKPSANLTILTSSCFGGGMLNVGIPGFLLAGCHETQYNIKSLVTSESGTIDPWMYAVVTTIKKQEREGRLPSYTTLFDEARGVVKKQYQGRQLTSSYKGPSPDETRPIPRDPPTKTSNQDPQLIYSPDYAEPGSVEFLNPFTPRSYGKVKQPIVRYF